MNNIPTSIEERLTEQLYLKKNHPVEIIKNKIFNYFSDFDTLCELDPYVKTDHCFDLLRVAKDHPSRRPSDTYYKDENTVLRTHMTACMYPYVKEQGYKKYVVCGDVYRKDTVDATHSPAFHQIDGFSLVDDKKDTLADLQEVLTGLVETLFPGANYRFQADEFPFTSEALECEVELNIGGNHQWVEILGGGVVHPEIMEKIGMKGKKAWAFGVGVERLAMILFKIPDIRLFWSKDERFLSQFKNGEETTFKAYSKYPGIIRDLSMWIDKDFIENDFFEITRDVCDNIESITEIDSFIHPKTKKESKCYRFIYRKFDETMTNEDVNKIHNKILAKTKKKFKLEIR